MTMLDIFTTLKTRLEGFGHQVFVGKDLIDPEQIAMPVVLIHMGTGGSTVSSYDPIERSDLDIVIRYIDEVDDRIHRDPLLYMLEKQQVLEPQIFQKEQCSGADTLNGNAISFVKTTTLCAQPDGWSRHCVIEFSANADYISEV